MARFIVIGLTDSHSPSLSEDVLGIIRRGTHFSGGQRHYEIVSRFLPADAAWIDIKAPLDNVFTAYQNLFEEGVNTIVVFASGDPLFFGFANTIKREMPEADIQLFPSFNSLQMLAHRLVVPYHDMRIVSLTGRPWHEFDRALIEESPKMGVLTDREHHPGAIAQRMMDYGYTHYDMFVGEHLGNQGKEVITHCSLPEAAARSFDYPNCLLLVDNGKKSKVRRMGIPDHEFTLLNGREKMITKMPIRLLTLQSLDLFKRKIFWDIGFCTGSVSIEARLLFPHLQVFSFEKREEGRQLMIENCKKFGVPGITFFIGDFMEMDLRALPRPDAVFIGGHGGKLADILEKVQSVLEPGGCIVMNAVTNLSRQVFTDFSDKFGLISEPPMHVVLNEFNPIDIMKVLKK